MKRSAEINSHSQKLKSLQRIQIVCIIKKKKKNMTLMCGKKNKARKRKKFRARSDEKMGSE